MELYYVHFVGISYERFGFFLDINLYKFWETQVLFAFILILSVFVSRVSEFMYTVFVLFMIFFLVPGLITYSHANQIPAPLYSIVALMVALAVASVIHVKLPIIKTRTFSYGLAFFFVILLLLPFIDQYGFYFNLSNLYLKDVYETRDYFAEKSSTLVIYLYNWLIKAFLPLLLVYFLIHRRHIFALLTFSILLYLYVISGNKIVYITSFVMLFFFFLGNGYFEKIKYFLYALVIGLLLIPLIDYYVLDSNNLKGTFVMRMLYLPSTLNYYYFDFFQNRPLYFAESNFFKMFVSYPFDRPVGFIIAGTYFNAPDMNANNGIISDGFINLGYWGIALNIAIVSLVFVFFNSTKPDPRYLGIFTIIIFLFLSAPMLSMFITSGLWIIFIMALTIMRRTQSGNKNLRA